MAELAIGIDLGGTNLKGGLVHRDKGLLESVQIKTEAHRGPDHVVQRIAEVVDSLLQKADTIVGIGVGSPGTISLDRRSVNNPPNFPGWQKVDLADILEERFEHPAIVENDANAAGLGSAYFGAGKNFSSFIMVTLGTGVGGAIIHEGKLFRGMYGGAGELGHISIDYNGPYARSGISGALEAYLGQVFLSHHARGMLMTRSTILHDMAGDDLAQLSPRLLHQAALAGDEAAIEVLDWAGHKLGRALGSVVNLLDIRKIVVGGGLSTAGDYLLEPARKALKQGAMLNMAEGLEIVRETLGNEAALLGAAHLAFEPVTSSAS